VRNYAILVKRTIVVLDPNWEHIILSIVSIIAVRSIRAIVCLIVPSKLVISSIIANPSG
jgi:hypothetical protein